MATEEVVQENWSRYWTSVGNEVADWDTISLFVLNTLEYEAGPFGGKTAIETGCGTGRISKRLAGLGAEVTCLDISKEALELAKRQFGKELTAKYVVGSILSLPKDERYDLVWNSGVIEHFDAFERDQAVNECGAILNSGGKLVVLVPYAYSVPYRIAKKILESLRKWPYGEEIPLSTLNGPNLRHIVCVREYTIAFLPFVLDSAKFLSFLRPACRAVTDFVLSRFSASTIVRFDKLLSRIFGGYLLVSVFERLDSEVG